MKLFFISLSTIFLLSAASVLSPYKTGIAVYDIIKEFDTLTFESFKYNIISLEEIREMGKNENLISKLKDRNKLTSLRKIKLYEEQKSMFLGLRKGGMDNFLKWDEIEFNDFTYTIKNKNGIKMVEGTLYFEHKSDLFSINVEAWHNGADYRLVWLYNLSYLKK
jgi:hypothetical protein